MDYIIKDLKIPSKNVFPTASSDLFTVVVHSVWLRNCFKNKEIDHSINNVEFTLQPGESIPYPWKKIFIKVLSKNNSKVLSLPRYKINNGNTENNLTFAQLLQYVAQTNHRNLWKDAYKKYSHNNDITKERTTVNLQDHDQLLTEVILRLYGCNIVKIKTDNCGKLPEFQDISLRTKSYDTHPNLLTSMFVLESDHSFFIVYQSHYENNLLDCLNFSPNLIDKNYSRGLFLIYQLLNVCKAMSDRGLSIGTLKLQDIYLNENLWMQVVPPLLNNIHSLDSSLINEQNKSKATSTPSKSVNSKNESSIRSDSMKLETLCMLWVHGRISNLDYLLHLNQLAGRSPRDPQAHYIVPWVTDFTSKCGRNWRDLSKSKYRLNKGDRQLDMTYDVNCPGQIPHHVSDSLSDITYYVYLARRTPKEVLCKHVRNKWVPAEYPVSIQRMQEWTPDECIPEFYTDPTVFKSIHEDLPDLGIPTWASCIEEFITKHREALESAHVSEALHHWIDLTFGYKLSGGASVKAKNVCLSLVDGHVELRRGTPVQILTGPHPSRRRKPDFAAPPLRLSSGSSKGKPRADSSEELSEEDEECLSVGHHVSRSSAGPRSRRTGSSGRTGSGTGPTRTGRAHSTTPHTKHKSGNETIQLPKDYNPTSTIQNIESLDNFRTKCFFSKAEDKVKRHDVTTINLYPMQESDNRISSRSESFDDNSFTNHLFMASYEQSYLKKLNDSQLDVMKEIRNRSFNDRYTTDAAVYKQFISECRKRDTLVIGCLIVEIFLNTHMRALRTTGGDFYNRYNSCRTVLKYNFNALPKCVSYIACLLLNVQSPSLSFRSEISNSWSDEKKVIVTEKGLPPPTASQMLQPLLMQHLIPFPQSYMTLYSLVSTLHEYEITSNELNILFSYECDGVHCEKYQNIDKTKLDFYQRISEGKILACQTHLETLLGQINSYTQFDVLDIFLSYYIDLLRRKETSVLAVWYLFDTVSKVLGPEATRKKLLKHILNLFEDDELLEKPEHKSTEADPANVNTTSSKHKFVKLYHNIFLLQLMVRLGLQCFLDNFIQHLVEAVGGYKDLPSNAVTPGHVCQNTTTICRKLRYSDDSVRNALSTIPDIYSPDTSYSSEKVMTPIIEKDTSKDLDNRSENDLFIFESDKERQPSASSLSRSPAESIDSYTITTSAQEALKSPTPSVELTSQSTKELSPDSSQRSEACNRIVTSPTIDIPRSSMYTSHSHFGDDDRGSFDVHLQGGSQLVNSLELNKNIPRVKKVTMSEEATNKSSSDECKISDMSSESILWLSNRLGPVLTCRYITRNLLKMLTLCYIGKENLMPWDSDLDKDDFDSISIVNSRVMGDKNAMKVIKCLTCIIDMYGDQVVIFQYLPHMSELIASSRSRRVLSPPLEGGVVACLQLLKYLLPTMSDVKLMEHLQDTVLKCIINPVLRLSGSSREFPSGTTGRAALTLKAVDTMYALATRLGPEVTRTQLCVPALQRFFLIFDKAIGKTENLANHESETNTEATESVGSPSVERYVELRRDGSEAEWAVRGGRVVRAGDSSPPRPSPPHPPLSQAQEELSTVFNTDLAYTSYTSFTRMIGSQALHRSLKNTDTVIDLVQKHSDTTTNSREELRFQTSLKEHLNRIVDTPTRQDEQSNCSNSFGSNVTLVGNRIDIVEEEASYGALGNGFEVVAHKTDSSSNNRHLRGDWLIYWEHEIGRPEKETRFNLKQIKLQSFVGHTHTVKAICCLDNENSFMTGSKDKTVKLWSLRNQGDGNASSQCNWTYTGHKKGVMSLSFIESMRLAVSTDSVVHIWDPFMESVVSQLEHIKVPISVVRALSGPSSAVVAATTDATLKIIDVRAPQRTHDLKLSVPGGGGGVVRCVSEGGGAGGRVSVGLAGGHLATLDLRTGRTLALWKQHDSEVLCLASDGNKLLSSGLDQTTAISNADTGELIAHLKGTTEPVHCMSVYHKELISATTNNRIGVHTALDQDASFSSTKLRSDTFKGVLTCMSVLPLNRLLLLGSDNGSISLLC